YGEERVPHEAGHHAHESPPVMAVPLMILAMCALGVGAYFEYTEGFKDLIVHTPSLAYQAVPRPEHAESHFMIGVAGTVIALAGVGLAAFLYLGDPSQVFALRRLLMPLYLLSYGKLFIDQIYYALLVWPLERFADLCAWFDQTAIDGLVNLVGRVPPAVGAR